MFLLASDPDAIKARIDELRFKLDKLSSEAAQISKFIILTTERPKRVPSMHFIKDLQLSDLPGRPGKRCL